MAVSGSFHDVEGLVVLYYEITGRRCSLCKVAGDKVPELPEMRWCGVPRTHMQGQGKPRSGFPTRKNMKNN
jgi:hypothetical protein